MHPLNTFEWRMWQYMTWATGWPTVSHGIDGAPPAGQWVLQLPEVDPGERPHRAGPAVLHRRGQLRTGTSAALISLELLYSLISDQLRALSLWIVTIAIVSMWCFLLYFFPDIPGGPKAQWVGHGGHQRQQKGIHWVRTAFCFEICFSIYFNYYLNGNVYSPEFSRKHTILNTTVKSVQRDLLSGLKTMDDI